MTSLSENADLKIIEFVHHLTKENFKRYPMLLSLFTGVQNICLAKICFIKQQPDPSHNFGLRWVLPYAVDVRCTCTQILLQTQCIGRYHTSVTKDYFYTDEPMLFVNEESHNLRTLFGCDKNTSSNVASTSTETTVTSTAFSSSSEASAEMVTLSINNK